MKISNCLEPVILAMALILPAEFYAAHGRKPLNRALQEAALAQRATGFCSKNAQNLRPACRDAFISGAKEAARVIK